MPHCRSILATAILVIASIGCVNGAAWAQSAAGAEPADKAAAHEAPAENKGFGFVDRIRAMLGMDARIQDLKRELAALDYAGPINAGISHGVFSVRDVSVSCPAIDFKGTYIYTKARMSVDAASASFEPNDTAVVLHCRPGIPCIEIRPENRPPIYWFDLALVTTSPQAAKALSEDIAYCLGK